MMDALSYLLRETRINRANLASITLLVVMGCGVLFFQELRIRELESNVRKMKKQYEQA